MLTTYLLGMVEVESILAAQRRLIFELEETGEVALILCEHELALTIGRS
ncbi:MAG: lipoyl(octanoyl) transferase, partial [Planctomycetota bacterium]